MPDDRNLRVVDAYLTGFSMQKVGEQFGISKTRVLKILQSFGIENVGQPLKCSVPDDEFVRLFEENFSVRQIGSALGCSHVLVIKVLARNGIRRRSKTQIAMENERKYGMRK